MKDLATDGPFRISMKIMLVGVSGKYEGYNAHANIDLSPGKVPSEQDIINAIKNVLSDVSAAGGLRLAGRHEFVRDLLKEKKGISKFSVEGPDTFTLLEGESE